MTMRVMYQSMLPVNVYTMTSILALVTYLKIYAVQSLNIYNYLPTCYQYCTLHAMHSKHVECTACSEHRVLRAGAVRYRPGRDAHANGIIAIYVT